MKTTCNFFYTSPTPSVVVRESGSSVVGSGSIYLVVRSTQLPPPFLQSVTTTLPVVVGGCRIMAGLFVTGATTVLTVTPKIDAFRMAVLVVFAKSTEPIGVTTVTTSTTTTTTTTTAVAVVAALVGCGGLDCGGDHRGDHLRHTVFGNRRHTR